ncbi:hypothetical protein ACE102_21865 [Bradyrhizobium sp. vgs-9]|uniref:hypothetical protein n=1 Tax=Bradyrhizobium TaxID=374 RepID=UPI003397881E
MSDTEQSRNEETGQFTPSTEGLFGREAELVKAGYTVKKDPAPEEDKTYSSNVASLHEAAEDLAASRPSAPDLPVSAPDLIDADPNEAVTLKQAAQELSHARGDISRFVEGASLSNIQDKVDKARLAELKNNPSAAQELGLNDEDVAAAAQSETKRAIADDLAKEAKAEPATPAVDGLDPEVEKALKHPQVRQAIEEELGRADVAKQQYATALNTAHQYAQASLLDHFPELADFPVDQWAEGIAILHQSDPQRVQRAMGVLQRVDHLQQAQAQWQHHQAAEQRQRVESWAKNEGARYDAWAAKEGIKPSEIARAAEEYLGDLGVDRDSLTRLTNDNPVLRSSEFQRMLTDAARYRMVMGAHAKASAKAVPPVIRPGVASSTPRSGDHSGQIAELQKQLDTATGNKAMRIAAKITGLRRAAGAR